MASQAYDAGAADGRQDHRLARALRGRFALDDRREHRCRAIDVSSSGAALETSLPGDLGQHVVCYLDDLGRVEGRIVRRWSAGFAVAFSTPPSKREKLARHIALLAEKTDAARAMVAGEDRNGEPGPDRAMLRLASGRRMRVQLLDLGPRTAAAICPTPVPLGSAVSLDGRPARVVRVAQLLIGLDFVGEA